MSSFDREYDHHQEQMDGRWGRAMRDSLRDTVFMGNEKVVQHLGDDVRGRHVICYLPSEDQLLETARVTGKQRDEENNEWHVTVNLSFWGSLCKYDLEKHREDAPYRVSHTLTVVMPWDPVPSVPYVPLKRRTAETRRGGCEEAGPEFLHRLRPDPETVRARRIGLLIARTALAAAMAFGAYCKWGGEKADGERYPKAQAVTPRPSPPPSPFHAPSARDFRYDPCHFPETQGHTFSVPTENHQNMVK